MICKMNCLYNVFLCVLLMWYNVNGYALLHVLCDCFWCNCLFILSGLSVRFICLGSLVCLVVCMDFVSLLSVSCLGLKLSCCWSTFVCLSFVCMFNGMEWWTVICISLVGYKYWRCWVKRLISIICTKNIQKYMCECVGV